MTGGEPSFNGVPSRVTEGLVLLKTATCGPCRALEERLLRAGVQYRSFDVSEDPELQGFIFRTTGLRRVPALYYMGRPIRPEDIIR